MKKVFKKAAAICIAAMMAFTVTGCQNGASELEKELENYKDFNHIFIENGDSKEQYFQTDETYDNVSSSNKSLEGYSVVIGGKYACYLEEDSEERGDATNKYTAFLDNYTLTEEEKGDGAKFEEVVFLYNYSTYINFDYDIQEENGVKTFTAKLDEAENNDANYEKIVLVFEEGKITENEIHDGNEYTRIYTFDNVDKDLYKNFAEAVKSCNGATRAQVKEKIGDFVDKYHTHEDN